MGQDLRFATIGIHAQCILNAMMLILCLATDKIEILQQLVVMQ